MAELICPPLGSGSIDMNALHDAAKALEKKGAKADPDEFATAIEAATTKVLPEPELEAATAPDADPVEPTPVPAPAA